MKRTLALVLGIGLTAAACSTADTDIDSANSSDEEASAETSDADSGETDATEGADEADGGADEEATEAIELISPTENSDPLDLTGGATSSDEGVEIDSDGTAPALRDDLIRATEPWSTDWTRRTVMLDELQLGLPMVDPRDGIPPIDTPKFEPIASATWLEDREPGALVQFNDETRFYPLSILTRHEIVNDRFGDVPVAVSFCPLCNTALAFDTRVDGRALRFGVSGLLRNSDLVMWDDATTTLWQQITGEAIVGELAGTKLDIIPTSIVSYSDAAESFPDALSLSRETGFGSQYGTNAYVGYSSSTRPFLFDGEPDPRFAALSRVVGVTVGETEKAYPFELISDIGVVNDELEDTALVVFWGGDTADALDGQTIADSNSIGTGIAFDRTVGDQVLTFSRSENDLFTDAETNSSWTLLGEAVDGPLAGERLQTITHRNEFWFAWAAFFPESPVHEAG